MLFVAILAGGYFGDWQGQLEQQEQLEQTEGKLKEEYKTKKAQAINLDLYQQQVREIESSFGALLKQLPNRSQMDALLVDINQAGLGRGLQFDLFRPAASDTPSCRSRSRSPAPITTWGSSPRTSASSRGS